MFSLNWLSVIKSGGKKEDFYALPDDVPGVFPGGPEPPVLLVAAIFISCAGIVFSG